MARQTRNRTPVITDIPIICTRDANHRMVSRASGNRTLRRQNLTSESIRSKRRSCCRVVHPVVVSCPRTDGIHEIPYPFALKNDRPFCIILRSEVTPHTSIRECLQRLEIVGKLHKIASFPASVHHIPFPLVFKHVLVYRLSGVPELFYQRFAYEISIRTFRPVCNTNPDTTAL